MNCELQTVTFDNYITGILELSKWRKSKYLSWTVQLLLAHLSYLKTGCEWGPDPALKSIASATCSQKLRYHCLGGVCFFQDTSSCPYPKPSFFTAWEKPHHSYHCPAAFLGKNSFILISTGIPISSSIPFGAKLCTQRSPQCSLCMG